MCHFLRRCVFYHGLIFVQKFTLDKRTPLTDGEKILWDGKKI